MKSKILLILSSIFINLSVLAAPIDKFDTITTNSPTKAKVDFLKGVKFIATDSIVVPVGTTGQRDSSPVDGMFRLNSTTGKPEMYVGSSWGPLGGGDAALWATATPYIIGNVVIQSNKFYRCLIAHTSGTFATDLGNGDWAEISGQGDLSGDVASTGLVTTIGAGKIFNTMVNASAAIAYSKLNLTGSILNADVNSSAAIAYSKLNLTGSILNADIGSGAAIVYGKLDLTGSILNTDISSGAAIAYSKFASLSTGQVVCGSGGTASACTLSGGATVGSTGVLTLGNTAVTGQALTGYSSGAGTISSSDTILTAINKLNGNFAAGPALTGAITTSGSVASLGSFSSASLLGALTDESGTGVAIFGTSPTISAPNITGHATIEGVTPTGATGTGKIVFDTAPTLGAVTATSLTMGGTINANAILDVQSTTKAFLPPRMTNAQMLAISSPAAGMTVYNTDFQSLASYNGTVWTYLSQTNIQLDNIFSAQMSNSGVISNENKDFISGNASLASTTFTITFVPGTFTVAPNCWSSASSSGSDNATGTIKSVSATTLVVVSNDFLAYPAARAQIITCQKSGVDYTSASSNAFLTSSASTIALATDFSATISSAGVKSLENLTWLAAGPFTPTGTNTYAITFASSIFTVTPNCSATLNEDAGNFAVVTSVSSTGVTVKTYSDASALSARSFIIKCQKSGVDYTNAAHPFVVATVYGYSSALSFSANTSVTAGSSSTPFLYTSVDHDPSSVYSAATGKFTTPTGKAGRYHFDASVYAGATVVKPVLYKNGVVLMQGTSSVANDCPGLVSGTFTMAATDTMEVRSGTSATASGGSSLNTFSGFKVND